MPETRRLALTLTLALTPVCAAHAQDAQKPYFGYPPTFEEAFGHGAQTSVGPLNVGANVLANSSDSSTRWQNEYSIAINPKDPNNVLASSNDYRTGTVKLGRHASFDGGKTFSADGVLPLAAGWSDAGDPGVCFDGFGNGYVMGLHFNRSPVAGSIQIHKTTDGGRTFAAPVTAFSNGNLPDKPLITADQRTTGTYAGSLYVTFTGFYRQPTGLQLIYSRDAGASWSAPRRIGGGQGTSPAVGPGGEVYIAWESGGRILVNRSFDGGQSFAGQVAVASITRNPSPLRPTSFRCNSFPSCAVDRSDGPHRGRVHVSWSSRSGTSSEIFACYSDNRGATWSAPQRVNDNVAGDQFFQWMAVDEAGAVFCCWMDRRNDPQNRSHECYASASMDGGASWLPNWKASETQNDPGSSSFLGDYNGLDARRGRAFATWVDFRRGNQDLYTAAVQSDLEFTPVQLSAGAGGTVQLPIKAGPARANSLYILLASGGTNAGIPIDNATLFLNLDPILDLTISALNQTPFENFLGTLGAGGIPATQPRFVAPAGLLTPLAGRTLSFGYLTYANGSFAYGSNPVTLRVTN